MNTQEIFDKAVGGVIRQGDLSISKNGTCYYRHPNGKLACGVGHLLDDETAERLDHIQEYDGSSEIHEVPLHLIPEELVAHMELLKLIQRAHDESVASENPATRLLAFVIRMTKVAKQQGLEMKFSAKDVEEALA